MARFADDSEKFAAMRRELFTAVVGDVLDAMGFLNQFLPPAIKALREDMVVVGRAMPVLETDFVRNPEKAGHNPLSSKRLVLTL